MSKHAPRNYAVYRTDTMEVIYACNTAGRANWLAAQKSERQALPKLKAGYVSRPIPSDAAFRYSDRRAYNFQNYR